MVEKQDRHEFWQDVASAAGRVINCDLCRKQQRLREEEHGDSDGLGLPQPGWVGPDYQPGESVVFILQNPGLGGINETRQESEYQNSLRRLAQTPTTAEYTDFTANVLQALPDWAMWQRFVGAVAVDCISAESIAWLNVVKFRTPRDASLRVKEIRHGIEDHLRQELRLLKPAAVVTIGSIAQEAVGALRNILPDECLHEHLAMRGVESSIQHARAMGDKLRRKSLCRAERA